MVNKRFSPQHQGVFEARFEAQKIVFGPVVFQCVRYAWKRGLLDALSTAGSTGMTLTQLVSRLSESANPVPMAAVDESGMVADFVADSVVDSLVDSVADNAACVSVYAASVVLESCLSAGVVFYENDRYVLDKVGFCVLKDKMTQVNFDFIHDVCYQGLFRLDDSLDQQKPLGLSALGNWSSIYAGLSELPQPARSSWFRFDHYYSDTSFPMILPDVFATGPRKVMDIGANTGKFSCAALAYDPKVQLHLVDLPCQLAMADLELRNAGVRDRAQCHPVDFLTTTTPLEPDMDVIWMSQFLSCFSEAMIGTILQRAAQALAREGQLLILDTLWDRQRYDIATYCLINTSPYFTALASGNSKIYHSTDYIRLAQAAGLRLMTLRDDIGYCHSILRFCREDHG